MSNQIAWPTNRTPWTRDPESPDPARHLTFYLGCPEPSWQLPVPAFISANRLKRYQGRGDDAPKIGNLWALDSGGFTELQRHGEWRQDADEFGGMVTRFIDECGAPPQFAAPQDWMCEDAIIHGGTFKGNTFRGTGLDVRTHQEFTVENFLYLRENFYFVPWIPVLQGQTLDDYLRCADMYAAAGVDLAKQRRVGLGSVCRRQSSDEIAQIVATFHARGYRLHAFGCSTLGLRRIAHMLDSADSMAWSSVARRENIRLDGCTHRGDCRNCPRWAVTWRERVLDAVRAPKQLTLLGAADEWAAHQQLPLFTADDYELEAA